MIYQLTWITYVIAAAISMVIFYTYFSTIFERRYSVRVTILVYIGLYVSTLFFVYLNNAIINILINILIQGVLVYLYVGSLRTRITFAVFIFFASFVADFIAGFSLALVANMQIAEMIFGTVEFVFGLLTARVLFGIFAGIISNMARKHKVTNLSLLHWAALTLPPLSSIFVLYTFTYLRGNSAADIISSMIVVVMNFVFVNIYGKIVANFRVEVRAKQLEEQVHYYEHQLFQAEQSEKLIRTTRHDIKSLLIGFQADLQKQDISSVDNQISELLGKIESLDGPAKSGNLAIDAIINFKAAVAQKQSIYLSLEIKVPEKLNLNSSIICQALGNALDNAIEATAKIDDASKRIIQIFMNHKHGVLFLQIKNPFLGEIITDSSGCLLSAKREFRAEGIGLQSIRSTMAHTQGDIGITYDDGVFCLSMTFYDTTQ